VGAHIDDPPYSPEEIDQQCRARDAPDVISCSAVEREEGQQDQSGAYGERRRHRLRKSDENGVVPGAARAPDGGAHYREQDSAGCPSDQRRQGKSCGDQHPAPKDVCKRRCKPQPAGGTRRYGHRKQKIGKKSAGNRNHDTT
jgi:hypothetical protein